MAPPRAPRAPQVEPWRSSYAGVARWADAAGPRVRVSRRRQHVPPVYPYPSGGFFVCP